MSTDHHQQEQQERHRHEEAMVQCETTKGPIVMRFYRNWAPNGYDRVVGLFERHFFDESHFFRVLPSNLVQFGISYSDDRELQDWARSTIVDDPRRDDIAFDKSIISFAGNGPHSRSSQLFIAYATNERLGREVWEIPVGKVIDGMDNVDAFYSYGDSPPWGNGPSQHDIHGNADYIMTNFPKTDAFGTCFVKRFDEMTLMAEKQHRTSEKEVLERQKQKQQIQTDDSLFEAQQEVIAHLLEGSQGTLRLLGFSAIAVFAAFFLVVVVVKSNNKRTTMTKKKLDDATDKKKRSYNNHKKTDSGDQADMNDEDDIDDGSSKKSKGGSVDGSKNSKKDS